MAAKEAGADADGVTFFTTSNTSKHPGTTMQFLNSSQNPWSTSKLPMGGQQPRPRNPQVGSNGKPEICGWYDSSFDLARGLEVSEQDSDTLYQLWELSQN